MPLAVCDNTARGSGSFHTEYTDGASRRQTRARRVSRPLRRSSARPEPSSAVVMISRTHNRPSSRLLESGVGNPRMRIKWKRGAARACAYHDCVLWRGEPSKSQRAAISGHQFGLVHPRRCYGTRIRKVPEGFRKGTRAGPINPRVRGMTSTPILCRSGTPRRDIHPPFQLGEACLQTSTYRRLSVDSREYAGLIGRFFWRRASGPRSWNSPNVVGLTRIDF